MEKELLMPKDGVLCAWLKQEGDPVAEGEPVFEMETNKVVIQVESEADGVLYKHLCEEGEDVCAERPVAVIVTDDEGKC